MFMVVKLLIVGIAGRGWGQEEKGTTEDAFPSPSAGDLGNFPGCL